MKKVWDIPAFSSGACTITGDFQESLRVRNRRGKDLLSSVRITDFIAEFK